MRTEASLRISRARVRIEVEHAAAEAFQTLLRGRRHKAHGEWLIMYYQGLPHDGVSKRSAEGPLP